MMGKVALRETFSQTVIEFDRDSFLIGCQGGFKKIGKNLAKCLAVRRQVLKETTYFILADP